jgi:hypothetical protein
MKLYPSRILLCSVLGSALATLVAAQGPRGRRDSTPPGGPPAQSGVYTTVSGRISQFNYDRDAEIEGFLLSNNILVHLPPPAANRIGNSIRKGDTVQITGYMRSTLSGRTVVDLQSVRIHGQLLAVGPSAPGNRLDSPPPPPPPAGPAAAGRTDEPPPPPPQARPPQF